MLCFIFQEVFIDSSTRLHRSSRHWTWVSIKLSATNHQSFNIFTQNAHSPPSFSLSIRQGIFLSWQMLEKNRYITEKGFFNKTIERLEFPGEFVNVISSLRQPNSKDYTISFVIFFSFLLNHLPFANFICRNFFESQSLWFLTHFRSARGLCYIMFALLMH